MALKIGEWQDVQGVPHYKYGSGPHDILRIWNWGDSFRLDMLSPEHGWHPLRTIVTQELRGFFLVGYIRKLSDEEAVKQLKEYAEALYKSE